LRSTTADEDAGGGAVLTKSSTAGVGSDLPEIDSVLVTNLHIGPMNIAYVIL
jgi:hypothetical protein